MKRNNSNQGFTLIELLVVISIIGTLSSIVLAAMGGAKNKANDAKKMIEVKSVDTALKIYSMNVGRAPGNFQGDTSGDAGYLSGGNGTKPAIEGSQAYNRSMNELVASKVLPSIPKSPDNSYSYFDYGGPDGQGATFSSSGVCSSSVTGGDGLTYGTVKGADGKCWLDRNLGATRVATASNDSAAYGWYFQWGRGADDHQIPTSGTTGILSSNDVPNNGGLFILSDNWRNPKNDNLWQGVTGINNPCPAGFRLPTSAEWSTLVSTAGITNTATAFSSSLKLPLAGGRSNFGGGLYSLGSYGFYWSSSPINAGAYNFYFNSGGVSAVNIYRAYGYSVRCVKD